MALININKLKESADKALKDASEWTSKAAKDASNWTSQTAKEVSSQTSELSTKAIRAMLKGVDLDGLLVRIDEYQQKTGKDASKLIEFIGNLKQLQQDGTGEECEDERAEAGTKRAVGRCARHRRRCGQICSCGRWSD